MRPLASLNSVGRACLGLTLSLLLIILGACSISKKSPAMSKIQGLELTAEQLRLKVNNFILVFSGKVENGADQIINNSGGNRQFMDRALGWKANAIPMSHIAGFQFDPLFGLLDLWAFSSQMSDFFERGAGRDLFGSQQGVAIQTSKDIEGEITAFVESLGPSFNMELAKKFVSDWVKINPIDSLLFIRQSTNTSLAKWLLEGDKGIGDVLGGMDERLTDMTNRMNIFTQQMPKIGRWQGELFLADQLRNPPIPIPQIRRQDIEALKASFKKMADMAPALPEILERQRLLIKGDIQEIRIQALSDVKIMSAQLLEDTSEKSEALVDRIYFRAFQLLLMIGGIGFLWILIAKLLNRRGDTTI